MVQYYVSCTYFSLYFHSQYLLFKMIYPNVYGQIAILSLCIHSVLVGIAIRKIYHTCNMKYFDLLDAYL